MYSTEEGVNAQYGLVVAIFFGSMVKEKQTTNKTNKKQTNRNNLANKPMHISGPTLKLSEKNAGSENQGKSKNPFLQRFRKAMNENHKDSCKILNLYNMSICKNPQILIKTSLENINRFLHSVTYFYLWIGKKKSTFSVVFLLSMQDNPTPPLPCFCLT